MTYLGTMVESTTGTDYRWMRDKLGIDNAFPVTLSLSLFTEGTHYETGRRVLPSGTPLGRLTNEANGILYGPFDPAATDGRQVLEGFLSTDIEWPATANPATLIGSLVWFGAIRVKNLPSGYDSIVKSGIKIHPQSYFRFADLQFSPAP